MSGIYVQDDIIGCRCSRRCGRRPKQHTVHRALSYCHQLPNSDFDTLHDDVGNQRGRPLGFVDWTRVFGSYYNDSLGDSRPCQLIGPSTASVLLIIPDWTAGLWTAEE